MTDHSRMEASRDLEEDVPPGRPAAMMWFLRALGVAVAVVVYALLDAQPDLTPDARAVAGILALMAVWWMTEAVPLPVTSLLPIVLIPALTRQSVGQTAAPYASSTIFLFLGGFLIAIAMEKWNLHLRIALLTLRRVGLQPRRMVLGLMLATAFLSMWVSNTATALMMLPIATSVLALVLERSGRAADAQALAAGASITASVGDRNIANFGVCIVLAVAWSASIGGIGTLIGSPPNAILAGYAAETLEREISFVRWMMIGVPLALVFVLVGWVLMTRVMYRFDLPEIPGGRGLIDAQIRDLGPLSQGERMVLLVFLGAAFFWTVPSILASVPALRAAAPWLGGFDDTATAIAAGILLFILPSRGRTQMLLDWKDAEEGLPWGVLLLFGGGLSLAAAVSSTGLDAWFGQRVSGLGSLPTVWVVVALVAIVVMITEIASNTAMAATIIPILGAVAPGIGIDPLLLLVPATLALSLAFMLPVGTPPNAIVFATGRVTMAQMVRGGVLMNTVSVLLITLAVYLLGPIAMGVAF